VRIRVFAVLVTCAVAGTLSGQIAWDPAVFVPAAPDANDTVEARFEVFGGCNNDFTTVVTGAVVRTTVVQTDCVIGPPPFPVPVFTEFGPLPAGTYTYEVHVDLGAGPVLHSTQPLIIAAVIPAAPALSGASLGLLALILGGTAVVLLRRSA
jgi:hypothetical protein